MPFVALALGLLASASPSSHTSPSAIIASHVQSLIRRTQTTDATYALVNANEIRRDDGTIHEFGAEYNQGDLHRVETPRDRIVANCRTGWVAHLNIASGEISHEGELSRMACGIYIGDGLRSAKVTGSRESQFGPLQQLSIATFTGTRTYEVAPNGAIVFETIADQNGKVRLITKTIWISPHLPAGDLFSEDSLAKSVVAEQLKQKASDPSNFRP